ncbi:MAG: sigma-70 family RNA polymerase sigma factor [Phycisphaeraceae bacterium]|nr:sigma-70 family RNA polymerase sigma factor [Phycisphaeraceae bacterium]
MPHLIDKDLTRQVMEGDRAALAQVLVAEQTRLFNTVLRMLNRRDDAEEVTQEAMLKIVQHIDDFRGRSCLATWMTRIAMNLAISFLRKRRNHPVVSLDQADGRFEAASSALLRNRLEDSREPPPGYRVQQEETARLLQGALENLEDDLRAVVVLRDVQDLDYQQIAEVLGVPVGTVKSRLFRARLALRQWLADFTEDSPPPLSPPPSSPPSPPSPPSSPRAPAPF